MANDDIISIYQEKIPTVVSYDPQERKLIIGELAKADGINNNTNMFNFKMDLFLGEKEFNNKKKYWYGITYDKNKEYEHDTFTAREVTKFFIGELLKNVDLPPRLIVGEPAVRESNLKENFRKNIRDVFLDLGYKNLELFFEPFAVFQYYRHYENYFPISTKSEIILVIDIGGGTFNSCIIATTNDGKLSRGGANMLPLGLQGEQCGGSTIDLNLSKLIIEKSKKRGILWKDNPNERARSPILFRVEKAKIFLSEKIGSKASISSSYDKYKVMVSLPKGTLHQDIDINEELNGNDLKSVIQNIWRSNYGKIITKTVTEAEEKLKKPIHKIDKVIIAGGSSHLPFMREEVLTVLPTLVKKEDIYISNDLGNAVACGIACECKELARSKKFPDLTVGTIAPCLLNDLYLGFKGERRGKLVIPKVNSIECNGLLFSSPFEISKVTKSYELEVEMEFFDKLFYYFDDKPFTDDHPTFLNVTDYVISIPARGKISKKFTLNLEISENGSVIPTFNFNGKGSEAKKLVKPINCKEFYLDKKNIIEGEGFLGIDFGTSNSYLANFMSPQKIEESEGVAAFPTFDITHSIHEKLRITQYEINDLRNSNILTELCIINQARKNRYLMIFHSNKIEGNTLNKGETEQIINGIKSEKLSTSEIEAINLNNAFLWMLDNLDSVCTSPENFIRHINKLILNKIKTSAGEYRSGPVKIAGMDYIPPVGFIVPGYMKELADEITRGVEDRSPIEFAASIHTKLVMIHPFEDGNGRTARLVMNALLLKFNLPMIIINYADKQRYFDCIVSANNGDISEFIQYTMDCLITEIEEIKATIYVDSEQKSINNEHIENTGKNTNIFGKKFTAFLEEKIKEKSKECEIEYNNWNSIYEKFKIDLIDLVSKLNNSDFRGLGYSIKYIEYDQLSFEKYTDLKNGKNVPRTWFIRVDISYEKSYEKILFFFHHASFELRKLANPSPVSLCVARHDGTSFQRLVSEPILLREVGVSRNSPVFFLNEEQLFIDDTTSAITDYLILDVLNNYL